MSFALRWQWAALAVQLGSAPAEAPSEASASSATTLDVRWDAPTGCPDAAEIRARIDARVEGTTTEPVTAIARARPQDDGRWDLRLWLVTEGRTDERRIVQDSCEDAADAAALVIAIAVAPAPRQSAEPPDPQPDAEERRPPPPPPPEPEPHARSEAAADRRSPRPRGSVRVGLGVAGGALPGAGFSLLVAPGLWWRRARVELLARYHPPRRIEVDGGGGAGGDFSLWTLGGQGCGVPHAGAIEFPLCAGIEAGQLLARGVQLQRSRSADRLWIAATASGYLAWSPRPWLSLWLGAQAVIPLARPRFWVVGDPVPLHQPWPIGIRALLGPQFNFG